MATFYDADSAAFGIVMKLFTDYALVITSGVGVRVWVFERSSEGFIDSKRHIDIVVCGL